MCLLRSNTLLVPNKKRNIVFWVLIHSNCNIHFNTKDKVGNQPVLIIKITILPHLSYGTPTEDTKCILKCCRKP